MNSSSLALDLLVPSLHGSDASVFDLLVLPSDIVEISNEFGFSHRTPFLRATKFEPRISLKDSNVLSRLLLSHDVHSCDDSTLVHICWWTLSSKTMKWSFDLVGKDSRKWEGYDCPVPP
jgi:hypothetical protein